MTSRIARTVASLTVAAMCTAYFPVAHAEIVPTEAVTAQNKVETDRAKVQSFLDRANVKEKMQAMGVDGLMAKDRVAALTDAEVAALAQKIDTLPAGAAMSSTDLIIVLLIAILVAIAL